MIRKTTLGYVCETPPGTDLPAVTAVLLDALAAAGETAAQAEVYATGDRLPRYQRAARDAGAPVWAARRTPFTAAPVFDGVTDAGRPFFRPGHPRLEPGERARVLAYLRAGTPLLDCPEPLDDVVDPTRPGGVPAGIRTDGTWLWSDASAHYLDAYGLAPAEGLLRHIRAADHTAPPVDDTTRHRALAHCTAGPPRP
ncbi:hypothetical protein [Streptomyces sp. NPDC002067]